MRELAVALVLLCSVTLCACGADDRGSEGNPSAEGEGEGEGEGGGPSCTYQNSCATRPGGGHVIHNGCRVQVGCAYCYRYQAANSPTCHYAALWPGADHDFEPALTMEHPSYRIHQCVLFEEAGSGSQTGPCFEIEHCHPLVGAGCQTVGAAPAQ